jgi:hypothetical protein
MQRNLCREGNVMTKRRQHTLPFRRKINRRRVSEGIETELVRQLAALLLQAFERHQQGEKKWKR